MRFPDDVPVLSDGQVTLRAHRSDDVQGVLEQCADPLSQRWTTVPVPYSRSDAEAFVGQVVPAGWREGRWAFAVEAAGDDGRPRFCGTVELRDEGNRRAEVAFGAHPWARGRGIILAALRMLVTWGFHDQGLRTVVWWANTGNWASRRTAWRLGFSADGTVRRWLPQRGDLVDGWVGTLHVDDPREPRHEWLEVPVLTGERVRLRGFDDRDAERGLRGLVGSGSSQVSVGAAMRARDAARPTDADLAEAEERLVIVRRNWLPREDLPRNR